MAGTAGKISKHLMKFGIKPSLQRIRIYEYFLKHCNHPVAEQIYAELAGAIPTLSKTTVYNTLSLFMKAGMVVPVRIEENELRYDHNVSEHGHFKCVRCGSVTDFSLDSCELQKADLDGFVVTVKDVNFRGLCPECAKKHQL